MEYSETLFILKYENFDAVVNHKALKFIFDSNSKLSAKIFFSQLELQCYSFDMKHLKGKEHIADFTSRKCYSKNTILLEIENLKQYYMNFVLRYAIPMSMSLSQIKEVLWTDYEIQSILKDTTTEKKVQATSETIWENEIWIQGKSRLLISTASSDCGPSGLLGNLSKQIFIKRRTVWGKLG